MNKYLPRLLISAGLFLCMFSIASAQEKPVLTATLSSTTAASKSVQVGTQHVELAKITLKATGGDVYLNGIYLDTDVPGGLSNFSNVYLYRSTTYVGAYPNPSEKSNYIKFNNVIIGSGKTKTYAIHGTIPSAAAGKIRVGISGLTFSTETAPTVANVPIYGNTITFADYAGNPIPTPVSASSPALASQHQAMLSIVTPASLGFTGLASLGLTEGQTISVENPDDQNVYAVNNCGHKRLFLNPEIFGFYGHLGGFPKVKQLDSSKINSLVTSSLVRNCETNDPKVYGIETTGEDTGVLHWVNVTGEEAFATDPDFFNKVFCINSREFNWYTQGSAYTAITQVPDYFH